MDAFLVLDLGVDVIDGIGAPNLESYGLAGEGFEEDLHIGDLSRKIKRFSEQQMILIDEIGREEYIGPNILPQEPDFLLNLNRELSSSILILLLKESNLVTNFQPLTPNKMKPALCKHRFIILTCLPFGAAELHLLVLVLELQINKMRRPVEAWKKKTLKKCVGTANLQATSVRVSFFIASLELSFSH
ncbi:hypothetical protein GH714_005124 [Hevea brasiliensis]|uniref:Uncharacterized protein n=1 Tax=Hevea brasiliensis TaxID=3981 RepID=A0A6A6L0L4_HEVBR|nr:hypothetical protein GH714_005124 [Hevea brasiliensis]